MRRLLLLSASNRKAPRRCALIASIVRLLFLFVCRIQMRQKVKWRCRRERRQIKYNDGKEAQSSHQSNSDAVLLYDLLDRLLQYIKCNPKNPTSATNGAPMPRNRLCDACGSVFLFLSHADFTSADVNIQQAKNSAIGRKKKKPGRASANGADKRATKQSCKADRQQQRATKKNNMEGAGGFAHWRSKMRSRAQCRMQNSQRLSRSVVN